MFYLFQEFNQKIGRAAINSKVITIGETCCDVIAELKHTNLRLLWIKNIQYVNYASLLRNISFECAYLLKHLEAITGDWELGRNFNSTSFSKSRYIVQIGRLLSSKRIGGGSGVWFYSGEVVSIWNTSIFHKHLNAFHWIFDLNMITMTNYFMLTDLMFILCPLLLFYCALISLLSDYSFFSC